MALLTFAQAVAAKPATPVSATAPFRHRGSILAIAPVPLARVQPALGLSVFAETERRLTGEVRGLFLGYNDEHLGGGQWYELSMAAGWSLVDVQVAGKWSLTLTPAVRMAGRWSTWPVFVELQGAPGAADWSFTSYCSKTEHAGRLPGADSPAARARFGPKCGTTFGRSLRLGADVSLHLRRSLGEVWFVGIAVVSGGAAETAWIDAAHSPRLDLYGEFRTALGVGRQW